MRAVIQRVTQASVEIENETKGEIGKGLLVLLGIEEADNDEDIEWLHPLQDASLLDGALYGAPCPIHQPLSFSVWKMKKKLKEMN